MLYTKHVQLTDATETTLFTVPTGFHAIIYYIFIANHAGSTKAASLHFAETGGGNRVDVFTSLDVTSGGKETLGNGGGPLFVLPGGDVLKVQTVSSSDMEFVVTLDLLPAPAALSSFA